MVGAFAVTLLCCSPVLARGDEFLPPGTDARRSLVDDNPYLGGQPSDLVLQVESGTFLGPACGRRSGQILQQAEVVIVVDWKTSAGWLGAATVQAEAPALPPGLHAGITTGPAGPDALTIFWNGLSSNGLLSGTHWTLASVERDGQDCLAGPTPEAVQGSDTVWQGIRLTPPAAFEIGAYDGPSASPTAMRYTLTLDYHPQAGDGCGTLGFLLRGQYVHTYHRRGRDRVRQRAGAGDGIPMGRLTRHRSARDDAACVDPAADRCRRQRVQPRRTRAAACEFRRERALLRHARCRAHGSNHDQRLHAHAAGESVAVRDECCDRVGQRRRSALRRADREGSVRCHARGAVVGARRGLRHRLHRGADVHARFHGADRVSVRHR